MEVFVTVISGIFVFVASQWLLRFILEPFREVCALGPKLKGLLYEKANRMHDRTDESLLLKSEIRKIAANYAEKTAFIPWYSKLHRYFGTPSLQEIDCLILLLTNISNSVTRADPEDPIDEKINRVFAILRLGKVGPWSSERGRRTRKKVG